MAIPVHLLWKVQMNLRQKVGLLALFALSLITMVLSIVRVEVAIRGPREDDTWFYICTTIELTTGKPSTSPCSERYLSMFSLFFFSSDISNLPGLIPRPFHP